MAYRNDKKTQNGKSIKYSSERVKLLICKNYNRFNYKGQSDDEKSMILEYVKKNISDEKLIIPGDRTENWTKKDLIRELNRIVSLTFPIAYP